MGAGWLVIALSLLGGLSAHAQSDSGVMIEHAYARPTPPGASVGAVYVEISNHSKAAVQVDVVRSAVAEKIEMHSMREQDGMMKMRRMIGGATIAPGEKLSLAPGTDHIMLIGLKSALVAGQSFDLLLQVDDQTVPVSVTVGDHSDLADEHSGEHNHH